MAACAATSFIFHRVFNISISSAWKKDIFSVTKPFSDKKVCCSDEWSNCQVTFLLFWAKVEEPLFVASF